MLLEFAAEEFSACLDAVVGEFLAAADWQAPPVDALELARRGGMPVAVDTRLAGRARTVHLSTARNAQQASILLRPEPRAERRQWAVAHEIGEQLAAQVFDRINASPEEAGPGARERVANLLAGRLLLPSGWFDVDARDCGWELPELKARYATASHELIARRMLDFASPVIITVMDQGTQHWRKSNQPGRVPPLTPIEAASWRQVHESGRAIAVADHDLRVQVWPVHEPEWRREILRTEWPDASLF